MATNKVVEESLDALQFIIGKNGQSMQQTGNKKRKQGKKVNPKEEKDDEKKEVKKEEKEELKEKFETKEDTSVPSAPQKEKEIPKEESSSKPFDENRPENEPPEKHEKRNTVEADSPEKPKEKKAVQHSIREDRSIGREISQEELEEIKGKEISFTIVKKYVDGTKETEKDEDRSRLTLTDKDTGEIIEIDRDMFVLGVNSRCDYRFPEDSYISRRHVEISHDEYGYFVKDLGSTNGTYINDAKVRGKEMLRDGDILKLADIEFDVLIR